MRTCAHECVCVRAHCSSRGACVCEVGVKVLNCCSFDEFSITVHMMSSYTLHVRMTSIWFKHAGTALRCFALFTGWRLGAMRDQNKKSNVHADFR